MSETKAVLSILMLAFFFNLVMWGLMDFYSTTGTADLNCGTELNYSIVQNISDIQNIDDIRQFEQCQPEGLPWWYYVIWAIINFVLLYAFIPFVK